MNRNFKEIEGRVMFMCVGVYWNIWSLCEW